MNTCKKKLTLEDLVADGFTAKMAKQYLRDIEDDERNPAFDADTIAWAHSKGILCKNISAWALNEKNYQQYMSDYDFYKIWPINNWMRMWINDKLTLKYLLQNTKYSAVMPEYYFYMAPDGLRELVDNPCKGKQDMDAFLQVLREKGIFACKPNNGALSAGFCIMEYKNGTYFLNGEKIGKEKIEEFVLNSPNYIYTEFLTPCEPFRSIDSKIHTIRMIVMNPKGNDPKIVNCCSIRYAMDENTGVNYTRLTAETSAQACNMYSHLNLESGCFDRTKLTYLTETVETHVHPVKGVSLDVDIPYFDELIETVKGIASHLFGVEWMGFDVCITDKGIRIMEINSHPGHTSTQLFSSLYDDPEVEAYLKGKLHAIDAMTPEQKLRRAEIQR